MISLLHALENEHHLASHSQGCFVLGLKTCCFRDEVYKNPTISSADNEIVSGADT